MALILLPFDLADKAAAPRGGRRSGKAGSAGKDGIASSARASTTARTSAAATRRTSSARHIQARALRAKEML